MSPSVVGKPPSADQSHAVCTCGSCARQKNEVYARQIFKKFHVSDFQEQEESICSSKGELDFSLCRKEVNVELVLSFKRLRCRKIEEGTRLAGVALGRFEGVECIFQHLVILLLNPLQAQARRRPPIRKRLPTPNIHISLDLNLTSKMRSDSKPHHAQVARRHALNWPHLAGRPLQPAALEEKLKQPGQSAEQ